MQVFIRRIMEQQCAKHRNKSVFLMAILGSTELTKQDRFKSYPFFWINSVVIGHSSSICLTDGIFFTNACLWGLFFFFFFLASLSGKFLQKLLELITSSKWHSLCSHICPPTLLAITGGSCNKYIFVATNTCTVATKHIFCESRGDRPGLPVLMRLMVSVDVKQH